MHVYFTKQSLVNAEIRYAKHHPDRWEEWYKTLDGYREALITWPIEELMHELGYSECEYDLYGDDLGILYGYEEIN